MLLLIAIACGWDLASGNSTSLDEATWDPAVAAAADGVYVRLPTAGQLVRVGPDGGYATVDLDGASPESMLLSPDGQNLLVFSTWPVCDDDDPAIVEVEDCPGDDLHWEREVNLVRDGARVGDAALEGVDPQATAASFAPDNRLVALYYDFYADQDIEIDGVLDPTAISFLDLESGDANSVSIGFPAETVVFSADSSTAVVLSRSQVAVVALTALDDCAQWNVCVSYPLSLDSDQVVQPSDVALMDAAGERFALVSVQNQSELYLLNLSMESIDIKELRATPSAVALVEGVDEEGEAAQRVVVVYGRSNWVDVIDDEVFEVNGVELDESMNGILVAEHDVLLYSTGSNHDVYHFNPFDGVLHETRAENSLVSMELVDDGLAVGVEGPDNGGGSGAGGFYDGNYVMGLFDLVDEDGEEPDDPISLVLESAPVGLATVSDGEGRTALLLLDDVDSLLQVDLDDGSLEAVDLESPPVGLTATPAGGYVVAHADPLGLLSFVDADGSISTAAGFAASGLIHENPLPRRED